MPKILHEPRQVHKYRAILHKFMEHKNKKKYKKGKKFSDRECLNVSPEDIYKYMCYQTYGKNNASNDDTPLKRVETIEFTKKALSFFMPSCQEWDPKSKSGNPTKSKIISQFMNALKVKQVRSLGQPSRARCPLTQKEF